MTELTIGVNWLAVMAGAVIAYLVGWAWYSPRFFGERWARAANVEYSTTPRSPRWPCISAGWYC